MSSFGSAANLIRCVALIVLCTLPVLTAGCGATPTPGPLGAAQVQELVDAVQQTEWGRFFQSGYVYQRDVTPVQAWEIQGRALTKISPELADQKRAAVEVGCLPDGSVESGRVSEIVVTSPTEAQAKFREASGQTGWYRGVLQLEKAIGKWKVLSEEVQYLECLPYGPIHTP